MNNTDYRKGQENMRERCATLLESSGEHDLGSTLRRDLEIEDIPCETMEIGLTEEMKSQLSELIWAADQSPSEVLADALRSLLGLARMEEEAKDDE